MYQKEKIVQGDSRNWPLPSARALIGSVAPAEYPDPVGRPGGHPAEADGIDRQRAEDGPEHDVLLSVRIPNGLRRRYRQAALDADRPMRQLVIDALEQYLGGTSKR